MTDLSLSSPAVTAKRVPRQRSYLNVVLLALAHLFDDFYCNFLPMLLPILMPKLGMSLTMSGVLVMVMSLSSNVLQPMFGYFMDKYNFNRCLPYLIPFGGLFICLTSWAPNFAILVVLVALNGLAVSTFHPMAAGLINKVAPTGKLSLSMSIFVAGGSLGFTAAPVMLVYFINAFDLRYLPVLIIPGLLLGLWLYWSGIDKQRFVDKTVAKDMKFNLRDILTNKKVMLLNISMGLRAWAFTAMVTFLPLWAVSQGYDTTVGGWLLSIYLAGTVLGGLIGGTLNDYIGYKKVIVSSMALAAFPAIYSLLHPQLGIVMYIALFLGGALAMAANPGAIVWGQALLPNNPGMASGMMLGLSFGLGGIGAMFTSSLAELTSLSSALILTTCLFGISTILAVKTPER